MSSFYRSDAINHYKIVLPRESAWEIMNKLGQLDLVHVIPSSSPILSRPFLSQVKRCEEALQKVHNLQNILVERELYKPTSDYPDKAYKELFQAWELQYGKNKRTASSMVEEIDGEVDATWNYYFDLNKRIEELKSKVYFYRENLAIIRAGEKNFGRSFFTNTQNRINQLGQVFLQGASRISFKCGVIRAQDEARFERTTFRITKGNCLITCVPFDDIFESIPDCEKHKVVFFVLFPGKEDSYFEVKLNKLIQTYCQSKYDLPTRANEFDPMIKSLQDSYIEAENLLSLTENEINDFLRKYSDYSAEHNEFRKCQYLKLYLIKEKEIYTQLNEMGLYNNFVQGQIYVRRDDVGALQEILLRLQSTLKLPAGQLVVSDINKFPTNFVRNSYTCSAQEIVETYGTPRYKEANPALFTTVTFPFLFGVMFGDIAHGGLLFLFGLYLIFKHENIDNFILKILVPHRYLLTMMGFFAFYCGFIYNEFLSISLNLFGSCWNIDAVQADQPIPRYNEECVYSFGLDPVWSVSENYLNYTNSLKMKLSVIIGVVHMTLGVFIKATNTIYFRKYMEFFFEFIPQLLFMVLLFAYMDFLIIYKWNVNWGYDNPNAPSIITTMINIPLKLGKTDDCCGGQPMWGTYGDTSQDSIQLIFLIIAVVCVPLMLLPKPLYEIYCKDHGHQSGSSSKSSSKKSGQYKNLLKSSENINEMEKEEDLLIESQQQHDASEIFVHQMIQTIEYVLGCISNTASYLRLWALSLAHSQLAEVFLQKTVQGSIANGYSGIPLMIIMFPVFAGATFGVLLCMDVLECFLHTLRLHWVQFQNKFYKGDGFPFFVYSFQKRMEEELVSKAM